jgi:hypothetical protein
MTDDPNPDGPQMPEPVAWRTFDGESGYDYRSYEDNEGYAADWALRNPRHVGWVESLITAASAQAYAEPLAAHRVALAVAAERERLRVRVEQAYREGYWARETYNDAEVSDVDEKWARAKAGLLGPNQQPPATGK